ncbi:peptidase domain-containing ABC transporter [Agarilytica rhodophyticola]|uniref:peptidase domain-containing ABC transporter n=1 Tax=Agarilytica rhodophyticola TaxID=1737490 RepID=UPI000B345CEC|nr:peptidase domain-containing ABC transporter [Agarilytica rhodophyticola]
MYFFGRLENSIKKKLPLIMQNEASECLLACIAMILNYHGRKVDLIELRDSINISSRGSGFSHLLNISNKLNIKTRPVKVDIKSINKLSLPCILHWKKNHFVVLKSINKSGIYIHDPSIGKRFVIYKNLSEFFFGIAAEVTPTENFKKKDKKENKDIKKFFKDFSGIKRNILYIILLSFFLQLISLSTPFYIQTIIDKVIQSHNIKLLEILFLCFIFLIIIQSIISYSRSYITNLFSFKYGFHSSSRLFYHLIRLPTLYFSRRGLGDVITKFEAQGYLKNYLSNEVVSSFIDAIMLIIAIIAMLFYSVKLSIIVFAVSVFYVVLDFNNFKIQKVLLEDAVSFGAKGHTAFIESVRLIESVKILENEKNRHYKWLTYFSQETDKRYESAHLENKIEFLRQIIFGLENITIIYLGSLMVIKNSISLGMLIAFISFKVKYVDTVKSLMRQIMSLNTLNVYMNRLSDIVRAKTDINTSGSKSYFGDDNDDKTSCISKFQRRNEYIISGKIEVINLAFRYGDSENFVFRNINFTIKQGEKVVIVGGSGCGKTTLLKCLMGLYLPTEGTILIDGKPLAEVGNYRSQISGVLQNDSLFSGTIAENISGFDPLPDLVKIRNCAKLSSINIDIDSMPAGYNTYLGDMGGGLSGGQMQRIIIARALYSNPSILFMDEATSHLDVGNENIVNTNLNNLNITQVLVAHRMETVMSAERQINISNFN